MQKITTFFDKIEIGQSFFFESTSFDKIDTTNGINNQNFSIQPFHLSDEVIIEDNS